ncbi:unnamed protein product [marine sediment metagenome]|uniref:Uncharacterized protein n=1 Tax=marine sediment metagenome TaxID=412755 RepID=X0YBL9_9ZZZZ
MSDFGELCPLFETGVFKEVLFPNVSLTDIDASVNALMGTIAASHSGRFFTFGRTVVVTGGFVRRNETSETQIVNLLHFTSVLADPTALASLSIAATGDGIDTHLWMPLEAASKTFTSDEVLGFSIATGTAISAGVWDVMVRFKEK